ncbi:MAG: hypothetical protein AAGA75_22540 [Cyanobacteria bacterium P01_E01_bin.6]
MTTYSTAPSTASSFGVAWRSLANGQFWPFTLLVLSTISNVVYAHTPLVAWAAIAGTTLPRRKAISMVLIIWLINQGIGFTFRGYPHTSVSFTWGALMGIGTLLAVAWASARPPLSQHHLTGHLLWMAIAVLGGFVLYQGLIMLAFPLLADGHRMGWDIVSRLLLKQLSWTGAIALGHSLLLKQRMQHQD